MYSQNKNKCSFNVFFCCLLQDVGEVRQGEACKNMIKRPDSVPTIPTTAYKRPPAYLQANATTPLHQATYNGCSSGSLVPGTATRGSGNNAVPSTIVNPLDLSLRTIRVTPDSTAPLDDHVMYLDQDHMAAKMIPAHTPQAFLAPPPPGAPNYVSAINGAASPFGMTAPPNMQPSTVSYDIFQSPRVSPSPAAMSSRFSALHPLTSDLLQRNTMYPSPAAPPTAYDQYHHQYPCTAPAANYPVQPATTALYQSHVGVSKHISNIMSDTKALMPPSMFATVADGQMMRTPPPTSVQATLMHDIQSSSFHSAFQKPVCTKECCMPPTIAPPPPCACCWSSKPPMTMATPSPHHSVTPVQGIGHTSSSSPSPVAKSVAYKYQQLHLQQQHHHDHHAHHIPQPAASTHQQIHHGNPSTAECHPHHHHHHQDNAILKLQNSVLKVNSVVSAQELYQCDKQYGTLPPRQHGRVAPKPPQVPATSDRNRPKDNRSMIGLQQHGGTIGGRNVQLHKALATAPSFVKDVTVGDRSSVPPPPIVTIHDDKDDPSNGDRVTCWRPPVSFPDNGAHVRGYAAPQPPLQHPLNCDTRPSYQPIRIPVTNSTPDDENRVSSTSDLLVQSTVKQGEQEASKVGVAIKAPQATREPGSSSLKPRHDKVDVKARILMIQNAEKQLFASFNFDLWLWARWRQRKCGRRRNLLKDLDDDADLMKVCDKASFPENWQHDLASYKLSVNVPKSLIEFPEGFQMPAVEEKPLAKNSSDGESAAEKPKEAECGKPAGKVSILDKLVNKYQKRLDRSKKCSMRMRRTRNESESESESDSDSESVPATPEPSPVRRASRNFKPPVKESSSKVVGKKKTEELSQKGREASDKDDDSDDSSGDDGGNESSSDSESERQKVDERKRRRRGRTERGRMTRQAAATAADDSPSPGPADSNDDRELRPTRRRAPRKRSPLNKIASSDGYVAAESKKPRTDNLYSDSSLLGREQRALQVSHPTLCCQPFFTSGKGH